MSEFKGTKGKWVFDDESIFSLNEVEDTPEVFIANNPEPYSETRETVWMQNALLITKAPEMLEMLEELKSTWGLPNKLNERIKQLIKEATTL